MVAMRPTVGEVKRPKKAIMKHMRQSGYSLRPPTSSDRNLILHMGRPLGGGGSSVFEARWQSVKRFRRSREGGQLSQFSFNLAGRLYNSTTVLYRTSHDSTYLKSWGMVRCARSQHNRPTNVTLSQLTNLLPSRLRVSTDVVTPQTRILDTEFYRARASYLPILLDS